MLTENEKIDSFNAVKQFVLDGEKFANGGNVPCYFIEGSQRTETVIRVDFIHHVSSYNLDYDIFKSYGLRNPVWSVHKLLKWDGHSKELIIEVDQYREIRLKRV